MQIYPTDEFYNVIPINRISENNMGISIDPSIASESFFENFFTIREILTKPV